MAEKNLEGYRLVPVGEESRKNDLNILELQSYLKSKIKSVIKTCIFFGVFGLVLSVSMPEVYQSNALLLQEQGSGSNAGDLLSRYGGLLGISSLPTSLTGSEINPELLPQIVNSTDFIFEILQEPVYFDGLDQTISISNFYSDHYNPPLLYKGIGYIYNLPSTIKEWIVGTQSDQSSSEDTLIIASYSYEEIQLVKQLRDQIEVEIDELTGVIKISSEMPDAGSAAQLTAIIIKNLTGYLSDYKLSKLRRDLDFLNNEYLQSKSTYENVEYELSKAIDRNTNLLTSKSKLEIEKLRNERNLRFEIYNSLTQQLEQLKISINENTPVFQTLQRPVFPHERKSPKRIMIIILTGVLGLFGSIGFFFAKYLLKESMK